MALGTGKAANLQALLFLMTNKVGRGGSISSGEKTILKGRSMVTVEYS